MTDPTPTRRSFRPTPSWLIFGLLVVEGLLWLSERYRWFWFNEKKGWTVLIVVALVGGAFLATLLWFTIALLFRWRFQFSIRSLLVLTVAVAIPCSWFALEMKEARNQHEVVVEIEKSCGFKGGGVWYDYQFDTALGFSTNSNPQSPVPPWLRKLLGNDFFSHVCYVSTHITDVGLAHVAGLARLQRLDIIDSNQVTDAGLAHLAGLPHLQSLLLDHTAITEAGLAHLAATTQLNRLGVINSNQVTDAWLAHLAGLNQLEFLGLAGTKITDAGLAHLARLNHLQVLWLNNTEITDAGLAYLAGLNQLDALWLSDTKITDAGLAYLAGLTQLQVLYLADTKITDAGLAHLARSSHLYELGLENTKVTNAGVKKLQQALPNCKIER